ncbi:sigma-70 family RNA polymerase sigma factor [Poritiphilus flavus]|uniref:Sigma-70 family RNA polymerase sigma factor n=1 Tax=Poritiphilus flavus TaxID=2697053 RepID=A0A6L9E9M4_9FLAO|nr:sigma-70 family RNA polymerase sigma factor [Poritiphilus flavus]NAS11430.1 sigma-70 family RNA polymerase sigma factor [Poritiphilus flavus]
MYNNTVVLEDYQSKLFPYAYNILGSIEDAKDVVQDIMLKHMNLDNVKVENTIGYLIRSVINHSINIKKRSSKMTSAEVWLPEPMATEKADSDLNKEEIISYSLLVVLEKLSATERAVFILKEAFSYSHQEIAEVLHLKIENSRKLLSRAKSKLDKGNGYNDQKSHEDRTEYLRNYVNIVKSGDVNKLEKLLSDDIKLMADGGKDIKVLRNITSGKSAALDLIMRVFETFQVSQKIKITEINHQPALLFFDEDQLVNCQVFELHNHKIKSVFSVVDPLKLKHIEYLLVTFFMM